MKNVRSLFLIFLVLVSCKFKGFDTIGESSPSYPKIHYSSSEHNVGAPVALIYKDGTYSLFYKEFSFDKKQKCPIYLTTSNDLIHWQTAQKLTLGGTNLNILNQTIVQDSSKATIYALSFVDPDKNKENNNAYFQLSSSNNHGKTWTVRSEKVDFPIQLNNESNPTVCWADMVGKWILTVVDNQAVKIFSSTDLKAWKFESTFEKETQYRANLWLKATFFPIYNGSDWVMLIDQEFVDPRDGSSVQYFIGNFDGQRFESPLTPMSHWLDYGKDNSYNVVCSGLPHTSDPLVIGWKNNIDYTMLGSMKPFWGSFTIPRTLSLDVHSGELILVAQPIQFGTEGKTILLNDFTVEETLDISSKITIPVTPSIMTLKFKTNEKTRMNFPSRYGIQFENEQSEKLVVGYDAFKEWYYVDRSNFSNVKDNAQFSGQHIMPTYNSDSVMEIKLILDDSSVELFAENGKQVMTENFAPQSRFNKVILFAENGIINVEQLQIVSLRSIWGENSILHKMQLH